jgi:hypothetical protein
MHSLRFLLYRGKEEKRGGNQEDSDSKLVEVAQWYIRRISIVYSKAIRKIPVPVVIADRFGLLA